MSALGTVALLCALGAPGAQAGTGASFSLRPAGHAPDGYFHVRRGVPGATLTRSVRIVNVGDREGTVKLSAVDATTGATTGAVYQSPRARRTGVGQWIALSQRRLTLAPGKGALVRFTIALPSDLAAGQHLGGIVARQVQPLQTHDGGKGARSFSVKIVEQSIVAVQVDVPGAVHEALAIGKVGAGSNAGYQQLTVGLSNPGNQLLKGHGTVVISNPHGSVRKRQDFAIDTFVPNTKVVMAVVLRGAGLPVGLYRASIAITYGGGDHVVRSTQPYRVTTSSMTQAYGVPTARGSNGSGSQTAAGDAGRTPWLIGAGALALLLISGAGFVAVRSRRQARLLSRRLARLEAQEPVDVVDGRPAAEPEVDATLRRTR